MKSKEIITHEDKFIHIPKYWIGRTFQVFLAIVMTYLTVKAVFILVVLHNKVEMIEYYIFLKITIVIMVVLSIIICGLISNLEEEE